ncbi:Putative cytosolic protein [Borrelia nietonii YOR]|uniref:Cytosolic protein n=1 Tax=Borrelia nietonii YOR TaxID=1293576 RepID=A0ABN4C2D9_9SPIR|nr:MULTISPECIES: hypothetical protein [Borrelia]AHH03240.1 Putative cytosolic protein [Borrelia nietonii YOR]AHH13768.1 Putative cytosolic protein [Borrelia hermsii MTW]UPA08990.1 hypothetical protein bhYOR_000266 [Borrelia nietonii YOR]
MLFNKINKYVLLFGVFAFILAVILGIFARVPFITVLFRAFFQFIFFFCVGFLLEFIYKKYLYDLFRDGILSDDTDEVNENSNCKSESDNMNFAPKNIPFNENKENDIDNHDRMKKLSKYDGDTRESKFDIEFNRKLLDQISYVERTDPKIVAEAIKTLINKKE